MSSPDDFLARATCALFVSGKLVGTAWLCSSDGYLLTAGHLLGHEQCNHDVTVTFLDDRPRPASVVYWNYHPVNGIDCAVLRLDRSAFIESIQPLPIRLVESASGAVRVQGYGATLRNSSQGRGTFVSDHYPQGKTANALFRLDSKELAEAGYSGAPVFSEENSAVIAVQIEAASRQIGAGRDTILAMPLYRIAGLWSHLHEIANPHRAHAVEPVSQIEVDPSVRCQMHGVPSKSDEFVYQPHISALLAALRGTTPIIALVGSSGNGKTASAIEAAYRLSESRSAPKHIVWVSLGHDSQTAVGSVINRLAFELGFPEVASSPEERKVATCLRVLRGKSVLLIVDNVEPNSTARSEQLMQFLHQLPQGVRALLTTTVDSQTLLGDCQRIRVPYLDVRAAKDYALLQAGRFDPPPLAPNEDDVLSRLVRCTGGSPCLINLLVATMRHLSPEEVLNEVETLTQTLPDNSSDQHILVQRFNSHLAPIWRILSNEARELLLTTTIFRNPLTSEAMTAASGFSSRNLRSAVEELVSSSLLDTRRQHGTYRYELHQSKYLFALSRINEGGFDIRKAVLRLCAFYTQVLRSHPEGAALIEPDLPTILSIARWCATHNENDALIDIVFGAYDILFSIGLFAERIELAKLATSASVAKNDFSSASFFVTVSASTETIIGNHNAAAKLLREGMGFALQSADELRIAYMKRCVALNHYRRGQVTVAAEAIQGLATTVKAVLGTQITAERKTEAHHYYIDVLALEGAIDFYQGAYGRAKDIFDRMLDECEAAGWERAISYPLRDLAEIALVYEHNFKKSMLLLNKAERIAAEYRDSRQLGRIHLSLTKWHLHRGNLRKAFAHFQQASILFTNMGLDNEVAELNAMYGNRTLGGWCYRISRLLVSPQGRYSESPVGGE